MINADGFLKYNSKEEYQLSNSEKLIEYTPRKLHFIKY